MTDQIYYKIQYPLKKAINIIKKVDAGDPLPDNYTSEDIKEIGLFLENWEDGGKDKLKDLIKGLRQNNK